MSQLILFLARKNKLLRNLILELSVFFLSNQNQTVLRWKLINGEKTLRTSYPLNSDSIVFDVGGYKGDSTWDIYQKYKCNIYVFEPVREYYKFLKKRFKNSKNIRILGYGLAEKTKYVNIYLSGDATSVYGKSGESEKVKLVNIKDVLQKYKIKSVDLIELNIEGGEYNLLEYLIGKNLIKRFKNIQVQFHNSIENARERRKKIQGSLRGTHKLTYEYPFVWENWSLRNR